MNTSNLLFNPTSYGTITYKEVEDNGTPYIRNNLSSGLKEYINKKFNIESGDWHVEELKGDVLSIVNNRNDIVRKAGM